MMQRPSRLTIANSRGHSDDVLAHEAEHALIVRDRAIDVRHGEVRRAAQQLRTAGHLPPVFFSFSRQMNSINCVFGSSVTSTVVPHGFVYAFASSMVMPMSM